MTTNSASETTRKAALVSVRLSGDQLDQLDAIGATTGLTRSQLLREGLDVVFKRYPFDDVDDAVAQAQQRIGKQVSMLMGAPPAVVASYEAACEYANFVKATFVKRMHLAESKEARDSFSQAAERATALREQLVYHDMDAIDQAVEGLQELLESESAAHE